MVVTIIVMQNVIIGEQIKKKVSICYLIPKTIVIKIEPNDQTEKIGNRTGI